MNLEKRVEQLEQRISSAEDFTLIVIATVGCNPDKMGPERAIHHEATGYSALTGERKWIRQPGQSTKDLKATIERELRREGHKVYAVRERYEEGVMDQ